MQRGHKVQRTPQAALLLSVLLCALTMTPDRADAECSVVTLTPLTECEWQRISPREGGVDPDASPCLPLDLTGTGANDRLTGEHGDDVLIGNRGKDVLIGDHGSDILRGGDGKDTLRGGSGRDHLFPGKGNDTLTGGSGPDYFIFTAWGKGNKVITDFDEDDCIILASDRNASWPAAADIIAGVRATGSRHYVYTLRRGLTIKTDARLQANDFRVTSSSSYRSRD